MITVKYKFNFSSFFVNFHLVFNFTFSTTFFIHDFAQVLIISYGLPAGQNTTDFVIIYRPPLFAMYAAANTAPFLKCYHLGLAQSHLIVYKFLTSLITIFSTFLSLIVITRQLSYSPLMSHVHSESLNLVFNKIKLLYTFH